MTGPTALSIGNFDGVHRGHVALVEAARRAVGDAGRVVVLSFDPHPAALLRPESPVPRLSDIDRRRRWLEEAGADEVRVLVPSSSFLGQTAEQFIAGVVDEHRPAVIVEGPDFRFGRARAGTVETIRELGSQMGFEAIVIDPVEVDLADQHLVRVSSSHVRWLLTRGRVRDAATLLGRPYELAGRVVPGDQRGRDLGVPTANLLQDETQACVLPADGIYAGWANDPDGRRHPAAISIGTKPTFGANPRVCEAHLIGYEGPLDTYDWPIAIELTEWLRDQLRYEGVEPLVDQLRRDIADAVVVAGASPCSST
jgi:riboflavin kinase/FMN adenylyltransferase